MSDISKVSIKILGIGGGGSNTVSAISSELDDLSFAAMNTDARALEALNISEKILIGKNVTHSMGAGGDAKLGKAAILSDIDSVRSIVGGVDLLVICTSLGGGTGSGASALVADAARQAGAKTIAFCTMPFEIEGREKMRTANLALADLRKSCDAVIPLYNDNMLAGEMGLEEAILEANKCIIFAIKLLSKLLNHAGLINIDFADLSKTLGSNKENKTLFTYSFAEGKNYIEKAILALEDCPILKSPDSPLKTSKLLINLCAGKNFSANKLKDTLIKIASKFCLGEEVLFGANLDEAYAEKIEIFVLGIEAVKSDEDKAPESSQIHSQLELPSEFASVPTKSKLTQKSKAKAAAKLAEENAQGKFEFISELDKQRGFFDDTPPNIYKNEDLDVPTYLRKGIKLVIKKS